MATRKVATVFGGSGFIGRYVVKRLAQRGYVVRVAVRDPERALFLKPAGAVGQIVPLFAPVTNKAAVQRAVADADVVVNCVGILAETGGRTFAGVHTDGAGSIAAESAAAGVRRLVHLSAIGADPNARSRYAATKGQGEQAVLAAFPRATILRPSIVFGPEDRFFNRFAEIARLSPFMPVIAGATKMQPVYVADVADAVMAALADPATEGKIYELGGPEVLSFREILQRVLKQTNRDRRMVAIPRGLAHLQAAIMQCLPGKPLTTDQLEMLSHDNVVAPGAPGLKDLGIVPTPIDLVTPGYLARFQPGGGRRPLIPAEE
ncbi:complex I NDUFA9 subunit family protein [Rhodopila sp.]|uniref:complex I NDUFA9 subunit family protein n=1 Tax=Rhodopila sp. TaxID=2480087 RepID=UPI002C0A1DDE|nr:complex I NDUFA9 subunit family protein [Rhodopila sp.]HVZ09874.1 complex I NDUFA9 subunit family protein [Rhodopila sp.]